MPAANRADAAALKKEGNTHFGKGRYAEAVESYTAAIDLWMQPEERAVLYSNRSAARLKVAGEKQKALTDAERAIQLAPQYAKAHFRRGQALRALGDAEAAAGAMERVLELEPADGAATVALAELRGALEAPSQRQQPALEGAFVPGRFVPSPAAKAAKAAKAVPPVAPPPHVQGEPLVSKRDFGRVAGAATTFFERADDRKAAHEAAQPPKPPKTKAEEMFPGMAFPPGFGPDEPDWDPTYTPLFDRSTTST